jgi:hypothetical protein
MDYLPGEGEGKRNLHQNLVVAQDVYAVLFCGLIKSEYTEALIAS